LPRLSGRSAFCEETFAGICGNEEDASIAAAGVTTMKPPGSTDCVEKLDWRGF
jgi:hypothetical protein